MSGDFDKTGRRVSGSNQNDDDYDEKSVASQLTTIALILSIWTVEGGVADLAVADAGAIAAVDIWCKAG